jgi:hypothetical protein
MPQIAALAALLLLTSLVQGFAPSRTIRPVLLHKTASPPRFQPLYATTTSSSNSIKLPNLLKNKTTRTSIVSAASFVLMDVVFRRLFLTYGIGFPSSLGGCGVLFGLLRVRVITNDTASTVAHNGLRIDRRRNRSTYTKRWSHAESCQFPRTCHPCRQRYHTCGTCSWPNSTCRPWLSVSLSTETCTETSSVRCRSPICCKSRLFCCFLVKSR